MAKNQNKNAAPLQPYLSAGFDVGADFSFMSIAKPDGSFIGKPIKIVHGDLESLDRAVAKIQEAQKMCSLESCCFLESTGKYHIPLLRYLETRGLKCSLINPIITKSSTNISVRQIHNDKFDSQKIALLGLNRSLKVSVVPDDQVAGLRDLVRDYFYYSDARGAALLRLTAHLKIMWPQYREVFCKLSTKVSLAILNEWPTPGDLLDAEKEDVIRLIRNTAKRGQAFTEKKYAALVEAAEQSIAFGRTLPTDGARTRCYIEEFRCQDALVERALKSIHELVEAEASELLKNRIELLQSIPGVGFLSASVLMAEIGDIEAFSNARELTAYFGLDPAVRQSGKFQADRQRMSKRGSRLARRILHIVAVQNIRAGRDGKPVNPPLYDFYQRKCEAKPKLVAMGAVSHKLCKIIFAVLRDNQAYVSRTAEEHCTLIAKSRSESAA